MGDRPSDKHSIERINNSEGYFPYNCKWATTKEQGRNKRTTKHELIDGVTKTRDEWIKECKWSRQTVYNRINRGWTFADAINH